MCDEVSKIKNLRCTFFLFFHAGHQGICLLDPIQVYLVVNWPRKWAVFDFWKQSKISQNVLQKSMTFKNDFHFFGRVKKKSGPSQSFSTPNFLSGASRKGFNFMIAFDHKLIFSDNLQAKVAFKYLLRFIITPPSDKNKFCKKSERYVKCFPIYSMMWNLLSFAQSFLFSPNKSMEQFRTNFMLIVPQSQNEAGLTSFLLLPNYY